MELRKLAVALLSGPASRQMGSSGRPFGRLAMALRPGRAVAAAVAVAVGGQVVVGCRAQE